LVGFLSLASAILFLCSIYVLGRGNGWSRLWAAACALLTCLLPFLLVLFVSSSPSTGHLYDAAVAVASMGPMIVLFALAKAVSNRLRMSPE
jgi:peptidoglycan/LPS O-acetylase OafA/YrhL